MKTALSWRRQQGIAMLAVVMTLTILTTLAFMLSRQSSINASGVMREHERDQARYLAEAGFNHALWSVQRANCQGYSDLTDISLGGQKYSVTITPKSSSPVTIVSTGLLQTGTTFDLYRNDIKVYQTPVQLLLQPDAIIGKDTYVYKWRSTRNYGTSDLLIVYDILSKYKKNALFQFDLSSLSSDTLIVNAQLELYQASSFIKGGSVTAHRITQSWEEGNVNGKNGIANWEQRDLNNNWLTPGGDFDAFVYASASIKGFVKQWYQWDLTKLVSGWVAGRFPNYGVLLSPASGMSARFSSSDSANSSERPILRITYACECGKSCFSG